MRRGIALALAPAVFMPGCGQATPPTLTASATPAPTSTSTSTPTSTPTPTPTRTLPPTLAPTASPLAFPTRSEVELAVARYASSPPFAISFTFEVPGPDWYSARLHGEFLDVMRLDGPDPHVPRRSVAWAHPATVYGSAPVDAAGLPPEDAAAAVVAINDLEASSPRPFELTGLEGLQLDVHTDSSDVPVFGAPDGDFGLQRFARRPARLRDDRRGTGDRHVPGAPTELDAACADVQPILDSVTL